MGVFTFTNVYTSTIPPKRLFKALIMESHSVIPKLMPQSIIVQGEGGAGSINKINFVKGNQLSSLKNRVDELDEETFTYKYIVINLMEKFESITYEIKFKPTPEGGSKNKMTSTYYTRVMSSLKKRTSRPEKREPWECISLRKHVSFKTQMLMPDS